ncbi:hypothetical protein P692DRAFT_20545930 [Suillus brevipes Sb2]|nr:hypothetical protein P692DRAFT_20545930 [Suillus brevipes Sb2]
MLYIQPLAFSLLHCARFSVLLSCFRHSMKTARRPPSLVPFLRHSQVSNADTHQITQLVDIYRFCLDFTLLFLRLPPGTTCPYPKFNGRERYENYCPLAVTRDPLSISATSTKPEV